MPLADLAAVLEERRAAAGHPIVVGISGYGGAGKSTLARQLAERIEGCVRLRGDDFLDPARSHLRSPDWDGVERTRLVEEVLIPFRRGVEGRFRRYDWALLQLGEPEPIPSGEILAVDLIGLFHPEALPHLDVTVWCEVELHTATERGMRRDAALGRDHERLWREVWVPNERDFDARFAPRATAEIRFPLP